MWVWGLVKKVPKEANVKSGIEIIHTFPAEGWYAVYEETTRLDRSGYWSRLVAWAHVVDHDDGGRTAIMGVDGNSGFAPGAAELAPQMDGFMGYVYDPGAHFGQRDTLEPVFLMRMSSELDDLLKE